MRHQWPIKKQPETSGDNRQIAELRHLLALVQEIAGASSPSSDVLNEMARISSAYSAAPPILQHRFDACATETADWATAGIKALTANDSSDPPRAAARRLADELSRAIRRLNRIVL